MFSGSEIRMVLGMSAKLILSQSRDVVQTEGEWELLNITATESLDSLDGGGYHDIVFNVSKVYFRIFIQIIA